MLWGLDWRDPPQLREEMYSYSSLFQESQYTCGAMKVDMRYYIDKGLLPLVRNVTLSPNVITAIAFFVMVAAAGQVMHANLIGAGILILLSGFFDLVDGAVAKATSRATPFGALLDRVADRAADFAILAGIILGGHVDTWLGIYVLFTVLLASYISACLEASTSSSIGQKLSLRAVRLVILALACFMGKIVEGMVLLAAIGTYASSARLLIAYRLLR